MSRAWLRVAAIAWFAVTVDFLVPRMLPGDPAVLMLGRLHGELKPESLDAIRAAFGIDDAPVIVQYLRWVGGLMRGELGVSISRFPAPVSAVIGGALPWTLALAVGSTALAFVAGSAVGVAAARRPGGLIERVVLPSLVFLGAFPYFWLAMILVWGLSWELDLLPARRAWADGVSPGFSVAFLLSAAEHAILPVTTLVLAGAGGWAVGMRNNLVSMEQEPWAQFARARGLSELHILQTYMLPLAAVPQVAGLGLAVGYAISGALLTEMVFSYPGMGGLMLEAVRAQDWPLLQGLFLVLALSVTALSAAVDAAVGWLDPRAQERG